MKNKRLLVIVFTVMFGLFLFVSHGFADTKNENSQKGIPQRLTELENLFTSLKQSLINDELLISTLQGTIDSQNDKISSLTKINGDLQNDVSTFKQTLVSQSSQMVSQQAEISNLNTQIASLQNQLQLLQSRVDKLTSPPTLPAAHTITGTMIDSNNKSFFSGIELIDNNGKHYPIKNVDKGQFSFTNIPDGTYSVNYHYINYTIDSPKQITVSGTDITGLVIKLAVPTYTISGLVLDNSGNPLTSKQISLFAPNSVGGYWQPTGNDGSFILGGMAPGSYKILIGNPNSPIATLDVTVTDHDISGLRIISNTSSNDSQTKVTGNVYGENGTAIQGVKLRLFDEGGYYSTSTDNAGHYEINVREARTFPLIVAEQGYLYAASKSVAVNAGTPSQVELQLSHAGTIAGIISYSSGVQPQYVSIKVLDGNNELVNRIYVNNTDGSYQLNAPAGVYTLLVEASGGQSLNIPVTVVTEQTLTQNLTL